MSEAAEVRLWGRPIGAVLLETGEETAVFQYTPEFAASGIEVSPLEMPLQEEPYSFPALSHETFKGLPGLLADSLPDRYGNALINVWLARHGRTAESANAVERLCYMGARGMGALEFWPARGPDPSPAEDIQIAELVELAGTVLAHREDFETSLGDGEEEAGLLEILSVGMSAGGARAKAVIAWNEATNEVRSGQVEAPPGFEQWLLKFDGVGDESREDLGSPEGYGAIEYAYARMASAAGIEMSECRLFMEDGRRHFMTRRFDRPGAGAKLHMQSLGGLRHFDFNQAGAYSYEQAMITLRELGLSMDAVEQQFRRMAFNLVARNQDDHVKNIAYLMDRGGNWRLAPAFDVTYAFNPNRRWTARHQMSVNGRRDDFVPDDLLSCADSVSMRRSRAREIVAEVTAAVAQWPRYAAEAEVPADRAEAIAANHRLDLSS